ncbi:MAG: hypothetical protein NTY48_03200, partial [Candidatus Diapherotrites archaeon]|nr:hypothetical protein [Candidatus Diapherotrites archaeon]
DKALSKKKVSASEYFLIKKNYQSELNENEKCESNPSGLNKTHSSFVKNIPKESLVLNSPRKKSIFSLDDLRAKKRALERGLTDLNKHYKQGLIIQEDFEKHKKQVLEEISGIKAVLHPTRGGKDQIKGTEELIKEEEVLEEKEKAKRKKIIRRFYYKK